MSKPARFDAVSVLGPTTNVDIYCTPMLHPLQRTLCDFLTSNFECDSRKLRTANTWGLGKCADCLFLSKPGYQTDHLKMWNYMCRYKKRPPELFFASFCKIMDTLKDNELLVCRRKQPITYLTVPLRVFDIFRQRELERRLLIELASVPAGRFGRLLPDGGVEYQRQMAQLAQLGCLSTI